MVGNDTPDPRWRPVYCRVCRKCFEYLSEKFNLYVYTCDECTKKQK